MDVDSDFENSPSPAPKAKQGQKAKQQQPLGPSNATNLHAGKALEEIYQKKSQLEHILLRPDTYIGSTDKQQQAMWVHDEQKILQQNISYVPGLYKIFDEILVNAADNKVRDQSMDTIKVDIDAASNTIKVWNNGFGIPVDIHKEEGVYVPELIFGHLLTSSNYDDKEKKVTGGRNGYGAKLANIFSSQFVLETCDGTRQRRYRQVFRNNMTDKEPPKLSACKASDNWTSVTFNPDLAKFGMETLEADTVALMRKRVYDLAGILGKGVKVFLNGQRVPIKSFPEYVEQYLGPKDGGAPRVYERFSDRWEVCVSTTEGQFQQVSFVNSICTYKGGTHVNYILDQITKALVEKINKKHKGANVKPFMVRNHLWLFINCSIENPAFDSQTKENLTLRASSFGSKCEIPQAFLDKVARCGVVEHILKFANFKNNQELKKSDGAKQVRLAGIPKLDDANEAGTRNSQLCTLILTEGDSAKSLAISGLSIVGRDHYGVFPLRGKLLNVRDASAAQISANAEIQNIKQILGLQHGKHYEDARSLRYGHLMIMTDQDHDGSHIKGLIMNFLHTFYPTLLKMPGFLMEFITPIVKATKGSQTKTFYTMPEYEAWKESLGGSSRGWKVKYYKGLGTSTASEAKDYFAALDKHRKKFVWKGDEDGQAIEMAFSKKTVEDRKAWLSAFVPGTYLDSAQATLSYTEFVNKELILFSRADLERSIPSVMDGLKPGQRKILFASFKKKLFKEEVKVGNLAGYVSDNAAYHHGETSLAQTIVGMAQDFVGSNNINLLHPGGMFGTRRQGGKDAASARYIYTKLGPLTRHLFNEQDDQLLNYLNEDGQKIEPSWYIPIVPTVLINGAEGIGTGWSTSVPNYNPKDVVDNIKRLLDGEEMVPMHPWYRGFNGTIEEVTRTRSKADVDSKSYQCTGAVAQLDDRTLEITELPVRKWTQDYKEWLETLIKPEDKDVAPLLVDYKEGHTDQRVHFVLELQPDRMKECLDEGLYSKFKLVTKFSTSNMVLFDKDGCIRHYSSPEEIIQEFYDVRLEYYEMRRTALIKVATFEMVRLDNMVRFILAVIAGTLKVNNRRKADVVADMQAQGFDRLATGGAARQKATTEAEGEEGEDAEEEGAGGEAGGGAKGYTYLLSMPIWSLTAEQVQKLQAEAARQQQLVQELTATSNRQMWARDLDAFVKAYDEWEVQLAHEEALQAKAQLKAQGAKGGKGGAAKPKARGKAKAKAAGSDEEDDADDDDDDDFEMEREKPKAAAARKAPAAKKAAAPPLPPPPAAAKPAAAKAPAAKQAPKPSSSGMSGESSEPLSLAARLAGRFQQLTVKQAASGSGSAAAAGGVAAASIPEELDDDITSPAPALLKAKSRVAAAAAAKPKGEAAAAKRKPRGKKVVSSESEDDSDASASSSEQSDEEDVFELDAPSPAVAPKGKKSKVGPSPLNMKVMAKAAAEAGARSAAAAAAAAKAKPAAAAAAAPAAAPAAKKQPAVKAAKGRVVVSDDDEEEGGAEVVAVAGAAEAELAARPQRQRRAAAPVNVNYIEIEDSEAEEEEDDDSDFEAQDSEDD